MGWTKKIAGCFGAADARFAGHINDEERAFSLLKTLYEQRIGWSLVEPEFEKYLKGQTSNAAHVKEQMAKVREHFEPWLRD